MNPSIVFESSLVISGAVTIILARTDVVWCVRVCVCVGGGGVCEASPLCDVSVEGCVLSQTVIDSYMLHAG